MGFFSSLKRLLFAQESVAKSAINKGIDYSKTKTQEISEAGKEAFSDLEMRTSGLRESLSEKTENAIETVQDYAEKAGTAILDSSKILLDKISDLGEKNEPVDLEKSEFVESQKTTTWETKEKEIQLCEDPINQDVNFVEKIGSSIIETGERTLGQAGDFTEKVGSKVLEVSEKTFEKVGEYTEKIGEKVLDKGSVLMEKANDLAGKAGEKLSEVADELLDKAKIAAKDIGQKFDETVEKAQKWEQEELAKPKNEFSDTTLNTGGSILENKDDFFTKASQYADGNFDVFSEGKVVININPNSPSTNTAKVAGQEDHDGDGNELIDDAIIIKD